MLNRIGRTALMLTVVAVGFTASTPADVIYGPDDTVAGRPIKDWTAAWWRWATSNPYQQNPLADETGAFANRNQRGDVYFIGGAFGGTHERRFDVPAGKPILIPITNYQADNVLYDPPHTLEELYAEAAGAIDGFDVLYLKLDGESIDGLYDHRQVSPPYEFVFPEDNLYDYFGVPTSAGIYKPGVSDGYWVMLYPFEEGTQHTIEFGGSNSTSGFELSMTVHINVIAPPTPNIEFTPIGSPKWKIADAHLISMWIGTPPDFPGFLSSSQQLLPEPNHKFHPQLFIGPGDAHDGPYDHEFADGIIITGMPEKSTFNAYEWSFPNSVALVCMVVPADDAPTGKTPDSDDGPMIPNSICPLTFSGVTKIGDDVFDPNWGFQVPALDQVDPPFDAQGHSHIPMFFADAAEFGTGGPEGDYTYEFRIVDADGNGYDISAKFSVVAGPVVPLFGTVAGKTLAEWSVAWWQWAFSYPADKSPLLDETGEFTYLGDQGSVFFLAGTFGGEATRTATAYDSQHILFPTLNAFYFKDPGEIITEEEMRAWLDRLISTVGSLTANVDGAAVGGNPFDYRLPAPPGLYLIDLPENNLFSENGIPAGSYETTSDGYFMMLRPLAAGTYTLEFGGKSNGSDEFGPFSTMVTCQLTVLPTPARGDTNCDGAVDFSDIDSFVAALIGRDAYIDEAPGCYMLAADVDGSGGVDFEDIDGFVDCLINEGCR